MTDASYLHTHVAWLRGRAADFDDAGLHSIAEDYRNRADRIDALWRKYAVWCARQVQHLMTDQRSIDALDVAWRHMDREASDEDLDAARTAARAAALDAALDAAGAAAGAAARAARAAAGDAARAAQSRKLRQILDAGEWVDDTETEGDEQ